MKRSILCLAACLTAAGWLALDHHPIVESTAVAAGAEGNSQMLAHNVYFSLQDNSPANVDKLVAACHEYLADHPGVVFFACGTVCDLDRPVNDRDFDVALHVVFDGRESHDTYQTAPAHLKFIEENRGTWKKVRVFDSDVSGPRK